MLERIKNSFLYNWGIWLLFLISAFFFFRIQIWNEPTPIRHDMTSYYAYLPALFEYGDITLSFEGADGGPFGWSVPTQNGRVLKMTSGVSILLSPFYLVAHGIDSGDSFNSLHLKFVFAGAVFYLLLGLFFIQKILKLYFNSFIANSSIILCFFSGNLIYYSFYEALMSHVFTIFSFSGLIYFWILFLNKFEIKYAVLSGIFAALVFLIRPVNVILYLFPLLLFINQLGIKQALISIKRYNKFFLLFVLIFFLSISPQFIYWKMVSGDWFFYAYTNEKFFFENPNILEGLFSYRKGWLIYSPLMIFSVIGLIFLPKNLKIPLISTLVIFVFVVFSWWTWWYGGGFGSRPMLDIMPFSALAFASLLKVILERRLYIKILTSLVAGFFIYVSLFQTWQYRTGLLHWDSLTKEAYWSMFLKKSYAPNFDKMLKNPNYESALETGEE